MKTGSSISKLSEIVSKCSKDMVNLRNKITQMECDLYELKKTYKGLKIEKDNAKDELLKLLMEDKKEV